MKKLGLFIITIFFSLVSSASHYLSGYISYKHLTGTTYEFTFTIYADANSPGISNPMLPVSWGDNSGMDTLIVIQQSPGPNNPSIVKRVWVANHTYPLQTATYKVSSTVNNRVSGINNITNSANVPFHIETSLRISLLNPIENNSPVLASDFFEILTNTNNSYSLTQNFTAFDMDDDVISYRLVPTKGTNGLTAPGYTLPTSASVDPVNGEFSWINSTNSVGLNSFTIEMIECRNGQVISKTTVDLLINVIPSSETLSFLADSLLQMDSGGRYYKLLSPGDTLNLSTTFNFLNPSSGTTSLSVRTGNIDPSRWASFNGPATSTSQNNKVVWYTDTSDNSCNPYQFVFKGYSNDFTKDLSVLVYVQDSTLTCDTLCNAQLLSTKEVKTSFTATVFPNPFSETTRILMNIPSFNGSLRLYNSLGKVVKRQHVEGKEIIVERGNLSKGCYFYSLISDDYSSKASGILVVE